MKKHFLFLLLNLQGFQNLEGFAQSKTDSLQYVLKTAKQDTNKVFILNKLSEEFSEKSQYEKAIITANEAAKLSEKIFFLKGQ
ncbi:MAG: hypothetical protein K8R85_08450, partial [Bacteroidetes bacterium]|nr:hypothetical protein [Bacteroidota bacterium]